MPIDRRRLLVGAFGVGLFSTSMSSHSGTIPTMLCRDAGGTTGLPHEPALEPDIPIALEPGLPGVSQLAQNRPDITIILNHVGLPLGIGKYAGKREGRFPLWRNEIRKLSKCPNVNVKVGGLGMPYAGFPSFMSPVPATSEQLAQEWKPYIGTCIEEFGAGRCMFESNCPADSLTCSYSTVWNAFKLLASTGSPGEKRNVFHDTALRVYKLSVAAERG
jgi:L-fuconolactonase